MKVTLPYGRQPVQVDLPDTSTIAYPPDLPAVKDVPAEIRRAMNEPIGSPPLRQIAAGKGDAVVVINDITRPAPSQVMVEGILEELQAAGIGPDAVTLVIATGNHRGNNQAEIEQMIGVDLARRLRVVNHDCDDEANLTFVGNSESGLPVWVNSVVAKASVRVLTGLITPHHVAGYSGGRKSILPGVAGLKTIATQHSFPIRPYAPSMGWMYGNPFHEESVGAARKVGVDFIVNVVKNWQGQVVQAVAGDLVAAHQVGVSACEKSWVVSFPHRFDVVIVTPGGHPRDFNLHQAQKAVSAAEQVIAEGGAIVLVAECPDGIGKFAEWLMQAKSPAEVIERFRSEGFTKDQSSKAFMCARALVDHPVFMYCSGISRGDVERMFFRHAASAQEAVDAALGLKGPDARVLALPYAVDCVPQVVGGAGG